MPNPLETLRIATRESRLALWQAEHVKARLETAHPGLEVQLVPMSTEGDRRLDQTLAKLGGKGLFIKELELALAEGRAHIAVHSLKDVPVELPEGFELACVMEREDPRDAFVSPRYASLAALPAGARVGTSSLRREMQLKALRPDLQIEPIRGNLDTRLRKLDEAQFDAIVLAYAGLKRLALGARIREVLEPSDMLPAAAQGVLGIEISSGDLRQRTALLELLGPLENEEALKAITAERGVLRALGGSCTMPIAAHCTRGPDGRWQLQARLGKAAGFSSAVDSTSADAQLATLADLGRRLAQQL